MIQNRYGLSCIPFLCPRECNRLPLSLRSSNSLPYFKKWLKTHYFFLAFNELQSQLDLHLVADCPRLRFTFRCDLVRVINLICTCICTDECRVAEDELSQITVDVQFQKFVFTGPIQKNISTCSQKITIRS